MKSDTACEVRKNYNLHVNFTPSRLRVSCLNEAFFNDHFSTVWFFIINPVDNVDAARRYVYGQSVWFGKPLFESATFGTKFHSQVILPHASLAYTYDWPTIERNTTFNSQKFRLCDLTFNSVGRWLFRKYFYCAI